MDKYNNNADKYKTIKQANGALIAYSFMHAYAT